MWRDTCVTGGSSDEHLLSVQMSDPQHNTAGQRHGMCHGDLSQCQVHLNDEFLTVNVCNMILNLSRCLPVVFVWSVNVSVCVHRRWDEWVCASGSVHLGNTHTRTQRWSILHTHSDPSLPFYGRIERISSAPVDTESEKERDGIMKCVICNTSDTPVPSLSVTLCKLWSPLMGLTFLCYCEAARLSLSVSHTHWRDDVVLMLWHEVLKESQLIVIMLVCERDLLMLSVVSVQLFSYTL